MPKWISRSLLTVLVLGVSYVLLVQVLRWVAFGEEEREALALMEPLPPPPAGASGFKYLAFVDLDIPAAELDQALALELAAYQAWHAGWGVRLLEQGTSEAPDPDAESFQSPVAARYARRPVVEAPDAACSLRERDCLGKLRGHEADVRQWLAAEAAKLALAENALRSEHLLNPYPQAIDSPMANFGVLRLPINDIALQALDGDVPAATARACALLAAERRFLRQGTVLVDKMVHLAAVDGAAALVLGLRRLDPEAPLPSMCTDALAPVVAEDFLACDAMRGEFAAISTVGTALDAAMRESNRPTHWLSRWTLVDVRLMRAWTARQFAPMCHPDQVAGILAGRAPEPASPIEFEWISVDTWAAPVSRILASIAAPDYVVYQERLLDGAAMLRLQLAALRAVGGELAVDEVPEAAASPGYSIRVEDDAWVLPLRKPREQEQSGLRIPLPPAAQPGTME